MVGRDEAVRIAVEIARRGGTRWIGIDGCGGAGKSELAAVIAAASDAVVVRTDDFSGPHVAEWDWPRFAAEVVAPLAAGRPGRYRRWHWSRPEPGEWVEVAPGRAVLVEGVSAVRHELALAWDLTIWVDAPREIRLARIRDRDGEAALPRWLADWLPSEQAYVARERPQDRVDLIVRTC